jgi:hypothetical protein
MTVDPWLIDVAERGLVFRKPALELAHMQNDVALKTGHLLALNDPFVRRKILDYGRHGHLPTCMIRCIACGAVASTRDWLRTSKMDDHARFDYWQRVRASQGEIAATFLKACPQGVQAEEYLSILEHLVEEGKG